MEEIFPNLWQTTLEKPFLGLKTHASLAWTPASGVHTLWQRRPQPENFMNPKIRSEDKGDIVGHVAISPVTISDGAKGWFGLGPISVSPNIQRSGIGSKLMRSVLEALKGSGASGCVVLGDPAFYSRFGFLPESCLVLPDVPPEYFQAIQFSGLLPSGKVTYHEAFNAKA